MRQKIRWALVALCVAAVSGRPAQVVYSPADAVNVMSTGAACDGTTVDTRAIRAAVNTDVKLDSHIAVAGFAILIVQRGAAAGATARQRHTHTRTAGLYVIATLVCDVANDCMLSGDPR